MNDQIRLQYLLEVMYTWQEAQHTYCAAKKYAQPSLFANKLQNVNLVRLCFVNTDGASWLNSVLFWILKAVYGLLATPDSICYHNYSYYDIKNQNQAKKSFRNGCESEEIFEEE